VQRLPRGEAHWAWKGGRANSSTIHGWLNKWYPKAGACEECGKEGPSDYANLRHPEPPSRNRSQYAELCRACHMAKDEEIVRRADSFKNRRPRN
jgi:hypothetical protein